MASTAHMVASPWAALGTRYSMGSLALAGLLQNPDRHHSLSLVLPSPSTHFRRCTVVKPQLVGSTELIQHY